MSIPRGTNPVHNFKLPFYIGEDAFTVTYAQQGVKVRKTNADCTVSGDIITVRLEQEDTLKFDTNYAVKIQIKIKDADGNVKSSKIVVTTVEDILDEEVL